MLIISYPVNEPSFYRFAVLLREMPHHLFHQIVSLIN
jgi:hypothetical protein